LLETLAVGATPEEPELGMLVAGLPVAGFSGSLGYRFVTGSEDGLGRVRAKTGTLVAGGVHGLAGLVTSEDGTLMLFVAVADRVKVENTLFVRDRLDQVAAALAGCACAA
jgi:D-alanyl-D-alanine carboxypeptidase/D-alanyl-D-alanine-endopeptidase (penicillin-binding protein 4)